MDSLEIQSKKIERDHSAIKDAAMTLHQQGLLEEQLLSHVIDKAFHLGHQAGVNRGKLIQRWNTKREEQKEEQSQSIKIWRL